MDIWLCFEILELESGASPDEAKQAYKDTVTLVGFGTFSKVHRKARQGRNPRTGKTIKIKASKSVRFKPGKALKDAL